MAIDGVTTCLWFDEQAEEAAQFYVATFPDSHILSTSYYATDAQKPEDSVLTMEFELFGKAFLALSGGPHFTHSPAISCQVFCDTQEEVDRLWNALVSDGGEESMCWCGAPYDGTHDDDEQDRHRRPGMAPDRIVLTDHDRAAGVSGS